MMNNFNKHPLFNWPITLICYGDTIVADIINGMNETTVIHWHGIHQSAAPYMDGVPNISQLPIKPGKTYRYRFEVDHAGTHWWHSHTDHQRAFGLAGAMVVRQTREENVHARSYNYDNSEHIIMIQDWPKDLNQSNPMNILINGLGRNLENATKPTLYSKFTVTRGGRYRFRLISNGVANCPVSFSIDQHDLEIISSDGNDIEPIKVQKLILHSGERFDFVLNANREVGNYWIRVKEAILHYLTADRLAMPKGSELSYKYEPVNAIEFNGLNITTCASRKCLSFNDVKALELKSKSKSIKKPDFTLYTSMSILTRGNTNLYQIDDITFTMPKTPYLASDKQFCNRTQQLERGINCSKNRCNCTNILQVPAFKHIELVVSGKPDTVHPIHLHGYSFRVVGMGVLGRNKIDKLENIDRLKPLPRRLSKAPLKDTVQVPAYGYTIIRFYSNNPGYWFLHCHISTHAENGMSAVLRVGNDNQMKKCPVLYQNQTLTRFAYIRKLYPKLSTVGEARYWRLARNDNLKDHPCKRECVANQHMTCYYYMVVHYDETMGPGCIRYLNAKNRYKYGNREYINPYNVQGSSGARDFDDCKYADGERTEIMVVNGQLPGLAIEACYGDTIVADIINSMHETTTVHWHGIHQTTNPHMDGVPHITQYPIEPGQAYRYRFEVDHAGTHWWHSHTDHQRAFGLAGAMVVRQTRKENVHAHLYDFDYTEHIIMIQDWMKDLDESIPKSILINGLGRNQKDVTKPVLYAKFTVARGGRYRFRLIFNGVTNCPVSFSIDRHDLVVISSDGNDIEPIVVQKITLHGGERFDFVLNANRDLGNYWIRVKGYTFCAADQLHQEAILHYISADRLAMPSGPEPSYTYEPPNAVEFNGFDVSTSATRKRFGFNDVKALLLKNKPTQKPDITLYTSMNVVVRGGSFLFQMDDITFTMPKVSMLQTRNLGIGKLFCNRTQQLGLGFNCLKRHCKCTNVLQVPAFKHIEIVISGKSNTAHPIHLHGYTFRVVGMGVLGEDKIAKIEEIDRRNPLPRRLTKAPLKDTVQVPAYGYTIIRFYANNPGYWILHCHISTHAEMGMAAVLRVGEDNQMKMCPVSNCGLCNSMS
ncbi:Laccase-14 [Lucilia cuprina]|nr:Laccase-14 [Lucilia cuprina]